MNTTNTAPPSGFLMQAVALHQAGRLDEAEAAYRRLLTANPDDCDALHYLGLIALQRGRHQEAVDRISGAIRINPLVPAFHCNLGNACRRLGNPDSAIAAFSEAVRLDPMFHAALSNMGNVFLEQGKLDDAAASFRKAISIRPDFVEAHYNLGNTLRLQGKLDEAVACYRTAISIRPDYAEAHHNLGNAFQEQGNLNEAVSSFQRTLSLKPGHADAYYNLGNSLQELGKLDEAAASFRRALSLKPDFAEAYSNLGITLGKQAKLEEAIANYRKAISLKPDSGILHEVYLNLGNALQNQGMLDASVESYRNSIALTPGYPKAYSNLLFSLNYHPDLPAEDIFAEYRRWNATHAQPLRQQEKPHDNARTPDRRLRIGYVSPDLWKHSVRHFIEPLLAHHDKAAVEVFAYAEVITEDAVSARLKGYVDHWLNTVGMSDDALAETIRRDGIDILVDLAGHTRGNRLLVFARKPAPIQVSWLGYGYTTGLDAMDYLLADAEFAPPGCNALFSENLVRLPAVTAYRPAEGMGEPGSLPALQSGGVTFGSLSRSVRINHRVIRTWAAILKRLPGSRLMINSRNFRADDLRTNVHAQFAAHGVATERVEMGFDSPPWDVLRKIDISLDCFPHNSGTTLYESLYLGVPYITLAERPSVGRIGSSALRGIGHPEWIAATEEEYVEKAVALASDLDKLALLRATLREQMQSSVWMDEPAFTRSVEAAYRIMWQRWCRGLPAADIETSEFTPHPGGSVLP